MPGTSPPRRPLVSGNWKMHVDHVEAIHLVQDIGLRLSSAADALGAVEVAVHPPFTDLRTVQSVVGERGLPIALGAQHCFDRDRGAFTGEVSPQMLARLSTRYVLVGHSERRQHFGMTDAQVASTLRAVLAQHMVPVCCIGETEEAHDAGETDAVLERQLRTALARLAPEVLAGLVVAYEPVWAIGTGRAASAEDAQEACQVIRGVVAELGGMEAAGAIRLLYGGSVSPENASTLVKGGDIDGVLVGSASLDGKAFTDIIAAVAGCYRS